MKKLLLILVLLLVTGCSGEYNLTITDDKKVKENFTVSVTNQYILDSNYTVDEYLDHYSYIYKNSDNFKDYTIKTKESKPNSYFIVKRNYKDLNEYIESNSFKSMFFSANIQDTGKYYSFTTSKNSYLYSLENDTLLSEEYKYESFKINIKFYNEVIEHNADEVDKKNNVYTWYVDENKSAEESFIHFKLSSKVKYFVKIKDFIMDNMASITIVGTIFGLIALAFIYILYKNKKNNEI